MKSLLLALVCCFGFCAAAIDRWQSHLSQFEQGNYEQAETEIKEWIKESKEQKKESAAAYYNQGAAEWQQQKTASAVGSALMSAALENWPWDQWSTLNLISQIQHELGISEAVTDRFLWRLNYVFSDRFQYLILSFLAWLVVAWIVQRTLYKENKSALLAVKLGVASCLIVLLVGHINRGQIGSLGLLQSENPTITVFKDTASSDPITDLPSGTLVNYFKKSDEDERVQIQAPIAGWIPRSELIAADF